MGDDRVWNDLEKLEAAETQDSVLLLLVVVQ